LLLDVIAGLAFSWCKKPVDPVEYKRVKDGLSCRKLFILALGSGLSM